MKNPIQLDVLRKCKALVEDLVTLSRNLRSCEDAKILRAVVDNSSDLYTRLIPPGTSDLKCEILKGWNTAVEGMKKIAQTRLDELAAEK